MAYILIKDGNSVNVAVKKYIANDIASRDKIKANFGDECFVISSGATFIMNSAKEWVTKGMRTE